MKEKRSGRHRKVSHHDHHHVSWGLSGWFLTCNSLLLDWFSGPVLTTAIIAGTSAVKATSTLIPFCHPLPVERVKFNLERVASPHSRGSWAVRIRCEVACTARTGVEMEALTGASVAALTIYDMLKAVSHEMVISNTRLISKRGGKSDCAETKD
jgi:molybdenum cofactor biosynthesis protein MoaC